MRPTLPPSMHNQRGNTTTVIVAALGLAILICVGSFYVLPFLSEPSESDSGAGVATTPLASDSDSTADPELVEDRRHRTLRVLLGSVLGFYLFIPRFGLFLR